MVRQTLRWRLAELGLASVLISGCLRQSAKPVPPDHTVSVAARTAVHDYAQRLASSFSQAAEQLKSNTLTTAAETNAQLQSANSEARQQAFQPLDQRLNEELGGDRWDAEKAQKLFEQIAQGLRSVR